MGKGYLIDSNVVISYLDNKLPSGSMDFMNDIIDEIPNISVITQIEVLRFNTTPAVYQILEDFITACSIFEINDLVISKTISVCRAHKIKLPDAIIAATALIYDLILLTRNTSDFKNIENLIIINPWEFKIE